MKPKYITPMITPLDVAGQFDWTATAALLDFLIVHGIDGVLIFGTSGEFPMFSVQQKQAFINFVLRHVNGRVSVHVGTGALHPDETIALSNFALAQGAESVFIINPFFFSVQGQALETYYTSLACSIQGNIHLYNFPAQTKTDLSPALIASLTHKHKNIIGLKDSVASFAHTRTVLCAVLPHRPNFAVYSGFDEHLVCNILSGGAGCIGALSNFAPSVCSAWASAIALQNFEEVASLQQKINRLMELYSLETPFVPILKAAIAMVGLPVQENVLQPLTSLSPSSRKRLRALLQQNELLI
ncbi:MAG: dihydrodipicolinate synthase family protein [Ruthenibacterium sp.]